MRVLIIKLSSMGDIIHLLPAITDANHAIKNLQFDWVIEQDFQEIPRWHQAVQKIIPVALRKWQFPSLADLRKVKYDLIIDAQSLLKSAIITSLAKGVVKAGFDKNSAKEAVATFFYNKPIMVTKNQHAIQRLRLLFAQAIGYDLLDNNIDKINYGVNWSNFKNSEYIKSDESYSYGVFLHGTTWPTKHWPEQYWIDLAKFAQQRGYRIKLTWATKEQQARAMRLAQVISNIDILPHLSINQAVSVLKYAKFAIAVDTGFAHLAAAMDIPTVALYGPTDPNLTGIIGTSNRQINLSSNLPCSPCLKKQCKLITDQTSMQPCFQNLYPNTVWQQLEKIL